jgi:hypothetical protein
MFFMGNNLEGNIEFTRVPLTFYYSNTFLILHPFLYGCIANPFGTFPETFRLFPEALGTSHQAVVGCPQTFVISKI